MTPIRNQAVVQLLRVRKAGKDVIQLGHSDSAGVDLLVAQNGHGSLIVDLHCKDLGWTIARETPLGDLATLHVVEDLGVLLTFGAVVVAESQTDIVVSAVDVALRSPLPIPLGGHALNETKNDNGPRLLQGLVRTFYFSDQGLGRESGVLHRSLIPVLAKTWVGGY